MPRVKRGFKARRRRKRVFQQVEGYYGGKHRLFRSAKEALDRALVYAYEGRKLKKRQFRSLWQVRIGAAVKELGLSYSRFMAALKKKNIGLNRKMLAELAFSEAKGFSKLVEQIRS